MNQIARSLLISLLTFLLLGPAMITHAQVLVTEQFASLDLRASSNCRGESIPEADVQELSLHDLNGVNETPIASVSSACGSARTSAQLSISYGSNSIDGVFVAGTELEGLGNGDGELVGTIQLRVETATHYTLTARGELLHTGAGTADGNSFFKLYGEDIYQAPNYYERDWDEEWSGTLQPGVVYTIEMEARSGRGSWILNDVIIYDDGNTRTEMSFRMVFDAVVVGNDAPSWGSLKARY